MKRSDAELFEFVGSLKSKEYKILDNFLALVEKGIEKRSET